MSTPKDALHEDTPRELEDLSPEERERRAKSSANDVKLLTRYALICSAVGLGIAVLAVRAGVQGAEPFARGLTVGALTTLLNLRLLARGAWSLMAHKDALQGALFMGARWPSSWASRASSPCATPTWCWASASASRCPRPRASGLASSSRAGRTDERTAAPCRKRGATPHRRERP
jgi:hypothetical protein